MVPSADTPPVSGWKRPGSAVTRLIGQLTKENTARPAGLGGYDKTSLRGTLQSVDSHRGRDSAVVLVRAGYVPGLLYHVARPYDRGDLVAVIATGVDTAPGSAPKIEVDEEAPVGEADDGGSAIQPAVPKTPRCRSYVGPKAQLTLLVVSCSPTERGQLAGFPLHKGGCPAEGPTNTGSVVLDRSVEVPGPKEEGEGVDDLHGSRFCLRGRVEARRTIGDLGAWLAASVGSRQSCVSWQRRRPVL